VLTEEIGAHGVLPISVRTVPECRESGTQILVDGRSELVRCVFGESDSVSRKQERATRYFLLPCR